jgi:hypothetical protein
MAENEEDLKELIVNLTRKVESLSVEIAGLQPGAPRSSPTPSTLGREALEKLNKYKRLGIYKEINEDLFPGSCPDPFLSPAEIQELNGKSFANESQLIQWFEPHFERLLASVSDELGYKVILLNSERHPWTKDPHGGDASNPDGVGIAVELASFNMSPVDAKYANPGDTKFGKPANWVLRDSLEFVTEWKVNGPFNRSLGEGIDYHRRIIAQFKSDRSVQDTKKTTDLLVANRKDFMLARCLDNNAQFAYEGKWNSPGSKQALRHFVLGTLWPEDPRRRPWKDAIQAICEQLKVALVEPTVDGENCFLGYGACGRVFRVVRQQQTGGADGVHLALKVALGQCDGVARLRAEDANITIYHEALERADATIRIHGRLHKPSKGYSAILAGPVGKPLRPVKKDATAALVSLKQLHKAGLAHGDCRWENAIIVEERNGERKCRWLDLLTLEEITEDEEKETRFSDDVSTFFNSFHCGIQCPKITELSSAYLQDDECLEALLRGMAPIWQQQQQKPENKTMTSETSYES